MNPKSSERFAVALATLLRRIHDYCTTNIEKEQPFGLCIANPKRASVGVPSGEIQAELEKRATEHFRTTPVVGYYFRYWTPPLLPIIENYDKGKPFTADDYQLSFELPTFDDNWERTTSSRSLIYCPLDQEQHSWSDWFELQLEAIRFTPLLHQSLKEWKIKVEFAINLGQPGKPAFASFIFDYAINDTNFPEMSKEEKESWKTGQVDWKIRYRLAADAIKSVVTVKDLYDIARKKAASTRNPMLKSLFGTLVERIERNLVLETELPAEEKKRLIFQLREAKKRTSKVRYVAKRPAVCISDVECAQMLYLLIEEFLGSEPKSKSLAEAILFIWIAQHAAFSGLHLKLEDILSVRVTDVDFEELTILIENQEIHLTGGLRDILVAWIGNTERKNKRMLFQNISYDNLEDIIGKFSEKLYGSEGRLSPRDFLEKVHVIAGVRIPIELRRQITSQEDLIKNSPYRIDSRKIKKQIKEAIELKQLQTLS